MKIKYEKRCCKEEKREDRRPMGRLQGQEVEAGWIEGGYPSHYTCIIANLVAVGIASAPVGLVAVEVLVSRLR